MHLYPIRVKNTGKYGYIDSSGRLVLEPVYDAAMPFRCGYAAVEADGKKFVIDEAGKAQFYHEFSELGMFSEGLAHCVSEQDGDCHHGYVDSKGNLVIECIFQNAIEFSSGVAVVEKDRKMGIIRKDGTFAVKPTLDFCHTFVPGETASAFMLGRRWGLISKDGDILIEPCWDEARRFAEGLIPIRMGELWGLANRQGEVTFRPTFREVNYYVSEDLLGVYDGRNWRYLNLLDRAISDRCFTYAENFRDGLGRAYVNGLYVPHSADRLHGGSWGYVDRSLDFRVPPAYDYCQEFDGPLAEVWIGDVDNVRFLTAYIDRNGRYVWKQG